MDDFAVALFKFQSDYTPRGDALFVYTESPQTHRYVKRLKPWRLMVAGILMTALFWTAFILICFKNVDFNWSALSAQMPGGIFFFFWVLLIILANLFYRRTAHDHTFYDNVAKIYGGANKRPYLRVLPQEIESLGIERANYREIEFYVITVHFKSLQPKFLGRPADLRFGIDANADLTNLRKWSQDRGVLVKEIRRS